MRPDLYRLHSSGQKAGGLVVHGPDLLQGLGLDPQVALKQGKVGGGERPHQVRNKGRLEGGGADFKVEKVHRLRITERKVGGKAKARQREGCKYLQMKITGSFPKGAPGAGAGLELGGRVAGSGPVRPFGGNGPLMDGCRAISKFDCGHKNI